MFAKRLCSSLFFLCALLWTALLPAQAQQPAGVVVAWGADDGGQVSNRPAGKFIAVAAGYSHGVALRADGSLVSWGRDSEGQVSQTPAGTGFTAVSAGAQTSTAISSDGSLVSWGDDSTGKVSGTPIGTGFRAVSVGVYSSTAIRSDGSLVSWGDTNAIASPSGTGFIAVAVGNYNGNAIHSDGSLVSWGDDFFGQVSGTPTGTGFIAVASGVFHSVALRSDGSLVSWGRDSDGQVSNTPAEAGFIAVGAGSGFSVALRLVVDTTPPVIMLIGDDPMTVEAGSVFSDPGANALDLVDGSVPVSISGAVNTSVPGTYTLTYSATDNSGNTATIERTVQVVDTTPPTISGVSASPSVLKPYNHKLATITVNYTVADAGDPNPACWLTATSNEPDNGLGDGDLPNDIQIVDAHTIKLRAERSGTGSGRIYTITIHCKDASGNEATKTVTVTVTK